MTKIEEFFQKYDKLAISTELPYEDLILIYRALKEKRLGYDKISKQLKEEENKLEQTMVNKLLAEKQESAKTSVGTVYTYVHHFLVTNKSEDLRTWFRASILSSFIRYVNSKGLAFSKKIPEIQVEKYMKQETFLDNMDLLLATPYSKPSMVSYIGDGDPPPGIAWDSQQKLGIRKK